MSDFKAPDVVWIATEELEIAVEDNYGYCTVALPIAAIEGDETSFTLTTTAEANTRKAARDVLEKVRDGIFPKGMKGGMVHINRHWWEQYFEKLLTEYQDPQPTEASDEKEGV